MAGGPPGKSDRESGHASVSPGGDAPRVQASEPQSHRSIALDGRQVHYRVRVSERATRLRITIRPPDDLIVTVPRRVSLSHAEELLRAKSTWVLFHLDRMATQHVVSAPRMLRDGALLDFAGESLRLALVRRAGTRIQVKRYENMLVVYSPDGMGTAPEGIRTALESWYRQQAHDVFAARIAYWNQHYQLRYGRIAIKEQKSRWGSCSRKGNLNFNWRLLLAPLEVLDYVAIHELCHLREMNHSERFWSLVSQTSPDFQKHRHWLRRHGIDLTF